MSAKDVIDSAPRCLEALTAWPVILLVVILLLRREIRNLPPGLAQRLKKADIVGTSFEFSDVAVKALQDSIESGAEELKDNPDQLVSFVKELP